jgi:hypothetical protein
MLHSISRLQFNLTLLIGAAAYYAYIGFRYYRKEIAAFLNGKKSNINAAVKAQPPLAGMSTA